MAQPDVTCHLMPGVCVKHQAGASAVIPMALCSVWLLSIDAADSTVCPGCPSGPNQMFPACRPWLDLSPHSCLLQLCSQTLTPDPLASSSLPARSASLSY